MTPHHGARTTMRTVAVVAAALVAILAATPVAGMPATPVILVNSSTFLTGLRMQSAGLNVAPREYAAFWGIPFAKPPIGELRFKAPVRVSIPSGSSSFADQNVPACLQQARPMGPVDGNEDCLKLNIFTPNYDNPSLDVVVVLHGGGFMYGKGPRVGLQHLMDHDMVVVTVDYRLGVFGYLSFEDAELPGNMGMLDQVEALKWVRENIGLFGGNNNSITLAGFSAGSASALMLTMSPHSKGLFHKVIAMSGSPLNPWAMQQSARDNALRVANVTNCTAATTAAMVTCLQSKNAMELVALQRTHFQDWLENPFTPFGPVVDGRAASPFLPDTVRNLLGSRKAMDVPMILSLTADEGLFTASEFITNAGKVRRLDQEWETLAPRLLHFHGNHISPERKVEMARQIREHYLQNASLADGWRKLVQLMGDQNFGVGISEYARMQAAAQKSPMYFYKFGYRGQHSLSEMESGGNTTDFGVSHADDYQYLFEFSWSGPMSRPQDVEMRTQLINMWASFANKSMPAMKNVSWTPLPTANDGETTQYLLISSPTNMTLVKEKDIAHSSFWKSLNHSSRTSASLSLSLACLVSLILLNLGPSRD